MSIGNSHQSQKRKNWVLLFVLLALIGLIYAVSLMRMGYHA